MNQPTHPPAGVPDYLEALTVQLRLRDVPSQQIAQVIAEVRSHVHDSGQDPHIAFGSPTEYADTFTQQALTGKDAAWTRNSWLLRFVAFVLGCSLLQIATVGNWSLYIALPGVYLGYLLVLGVVGAVISRWLIRPWAARQATIDPGTSMAIAPRALVLGGLATWVIGTRVLNVPLTGSVMPSLNAPIWAWALIGAALVAWSILAEIRAARLPNIPATQEHS